MNEFFCAATRVDSPRSYTCSSPRNANHSSPSHKCSPGRSLLCGLKNPRTVRSNSTSSLAAIEIVACVRAIQYRATGRLIPKDRPAEKQKSHDPINLPIQDPATAVDTRAAPESQPRPPRLPDNVPGCAL